MISKEDKYIKNIMIVKENINDVLKGKSEKEINSDIAKLLDIDIIIEKINKHKMNNMLCLFTDEGQDEGSSTTQFFNESGTNKLINKLLEFIKISIKDKFSYRYAIIYALNHEQDGIFLFDYNGSYGSGSIKIISEIQIDSGSVSVKNI